MKRMKFIEDRNLIAFVTHGLTRYATSIAFNDDDDREYYNSNDDDDANIIYYNDIIY